MRVGLLHRQDQDRLDLARVAAHRSERIAALLTTYLAGVAVAGRPAKERLAALRDLLAALEA